MLLYAVSRKVSYVPDCISVYQSDYEVMWNEYKNQSNSHNNFSQKSKSLPKRIRLFVRKILPKPIVRFLLRVIGHINTTGRYRFMFDKTFTRIDI